METWYRINPREIIQQGSTTITPEDFERSTPQYLIARGGFRTAKFGRYQQYYPNLEEAQESVIALLQRAIGLQETAIETAQKKRADLQAALKIFVLQNQK